MDAAPTPVAFNRWLPYWAVLQADLFQTTRSWVYRLWVGITVLAAAGYIVYRVALAHDAGIAQPASKLVTDLLRWTMLGSVTLVVVLTAGSISAERGTMADSVLSRGISRHQYFLGKWHSRLIAILLTFWGVSSCVLTAAFFLLHEDLSLTGCLTALACISSLIVAIVTAGVAVSAACNSTVLGVAVLWVILYGGGFALSFVPERYPSPTLLAAALPHMIRGSYDVNLLVHLAAWSAGVSAVAAGAGLTHFARRDI